MDADEWDRFFARRELVLARHPNPIIVELLSPLPAGRALELGAGEGRNALFLARRGWHVTAVDFSKLALQRTARLAGEEGLQIECVLGDIRELDVPARGFDLVLQAYVQPDSGDRSGVLAAAAQAVAPGGHLLAVGLDTTDPNATPEQDDWRWTPERLRGAFPGIDLLRCERVTRETQTDEGTYRAIDSVAWGRRPVSAP